MHYAVIGGVQCEGKREFVMKNLLISSAIIAALVPLSGCSSGVSEPTEDGIAEFEARQINLEKDWEGATTCVVWRSGGVVQCFREESEAQDLLAEIDAAESALAPDLADETEVAEPARGLTDELETTESASAPGPLPITACSRSCLHLYEHTNFGGRHLTFCDRGYWQNLTSYGFNDQLSSYKTGVRGAHLAEHTNGGGSWYPGNTGVCISGGGMSSGWNDRVSSIYIKN
jgi:hypothetical protein